MTFASCFRPRCQRSIKKEGEIVKHVDGREPVVEFDRVEKPGPSLPMHDVFEMQVAMTAADKTLSLPLFDQGKFGAEFLAKMLDIRADSQPSCLSEGPAQRIFEIRGHLLKRLRKTGFVAHRSVTMEMLHGIGQLFHQFTGQASFASHFVQQRGLVEAAHHKQPIDGLTGSPELKALSAGAERYGHNGQIKFR